jgi:CheY-like chemotaxis protein
MTRRRVLVIDDVLASAEAVGMVLELAGHEVRTARSTLEALAIAAEFAPAVVISDLHLGNGPGGYELAEAMRADPRHAGARLLALSGLDSPTDRQRALDSGFDLVLVKPLDPTRLLALVEGEPGPA